MELYNSDLLTDIIEKAILSRTVNNDCMRIQHFKNFVKTFFEQFAIFTFAEFTRDRPDCDSVIYGNPVEAVGKTFVFAPTNIINNFVAENCPVPIAERSHSIRIVNRYRKRKVEISGEIGRDDSREVIENFCRPKRSTPYAATRAVEFVIVLIEMNGGIYEKILVTAFDLPIVNFSRLSVRDEFGGNFFCGF